MKNEDKLVKPGFWKERSNSCLAAGNSGHPRLDFERGNDAEAGKAQKTDKAFRITQ